MIVSNQPLPYLKMNITAGDEAVRGALTRLIAELGYGPTHEQIAEALDCHVAEVEISLDRLATAHAVLLHPNCRRVWVAHPFALSPGSCWVQTPGNGYWSNCLYCGFGVAAALRSDATITTRLGGEAETFEFAINGGKVTAGADLLFHLSTPAAQWWDNVIYACATFQPFRREDEIDDWCSRHRLPRGYVMTVEQLWLFASDWYGDYVAKPWHKRTSAEVNALFAKHGLAAPFWRVG